MNSLRKNIGIILAHYWCNAKTGQHQQLLKVIWQSINYV